MTTPTGADAMKEAERLIARLESAAYEYGKPESGMLQGTAVRGTRDDLLAHIRKLVEAQPAAVAGEAINQERPEPGWYWVTGPALFPEDGMTVLPAQLKFQYEHRGYDSLGRGMLMKQWGSSCWTDWNDPRHVVEPALSNDQLRIVARIASPDAPAGVPTDLQIRRLWAQFGWSSECPYEFAHALLAANSVNLPACDSSEASGSAIPARPTLPGPEMTQVGWLTQAGNVVTPVGTRVHDANRYGWRAVFARATQEPQ
jgi:hypothetical protein